MSEYKRSLTLAGLFLAVLLLLFSCDTRQVTYSDPLPSWNDSATKESIINFVAAITTKGTDSYVEPEDRIATFDNDGTLWAEKPLIQMMFVFYRIRQMAETDPSLKERQPYKAIIEHDNAYLENLEKEELLKLFVTVQTGMTLSEYQAAVADFFAHATTSSGKTIPELRYQPQLELLDYLRANNFKIYICSGGSVDFMRVISEEYYGIPPEQVIGTEFEYIFDNDINNIQRLPHVSTFNDKQEKPVTIQYHIGKRPILACGNIGGAGDIYMLRFSQGNMYPSLQLIVNHDDAEREFFYQEEGNQSQDWANQYGWQVINIKSDWKQVFAEK